MDSAKLEWIATEVMPHEAQIRRWLRRGSFAQDESDIVQEAYYRIWRLDGFKAIVSPKAYFFQVVRNILLERSRKMAVVDIISMTGFYVAGISSGDLGIDRVLAGRTTLSLVEALIDELPPRCAAVIRLRKIEGKPQRETASILGVSENVVEKDVAQAIRFLTRRLSELEADTHVAHEAASQSVRPRRKRS